LPCMLRLHTALLPVGCRLTSTTGTPLHAATTVKRQGIRCGVWQTHHLACVAAAGVAAGYSAP
jgi:hypothetical protein